MSVELIHVNDPSQISRYNRLIKDKPTMVLFYMDGCGHCEMLKPEWDEFEKSAKKTNINSGVARVNANYMDRVDGDKDVIGFPTIMKNIQNSMEKEVRKNL